MTSKFKKLYRTALSIAALSFIAGTSAPAQAQVPSSDEINAAVLMENSSIFPRWTNDADHPWTVNENGTQIDNAPFEEKGITSTLSFEYSSQYPVELTVSLIRYTSNSSGGEGLEIHVDGEQKARYYGSSNWKEFQFILPLGEHTVEFKNIGNPSSKPSTSSWARIKGLRLLECKPLADAVKSDIDVKVEVSSDVENLWVVDGNELHTLPDYKGETTLTFEFTTYDHAMFSCDLQWDADNYANSDEYIKIEYDGYERFYTTNRSQTNVNFILDPGKHSVCVKRETAENRNVKIKSKVSNIMLTGKWTDVTLANPGDLGREILYKVETLGDVKLLRISGSMNENDWNTISQMQSNIYGIDLRNTTLTEIPRKAFYNYGKLSTVLLPNTIKTIGDQAFSATDAGIYRIPASVESIGSGVWEATHLAEITFPEDSKLREIKGQTFNSCVKLREFKMPDTVTTIGNELFRGCSLLETIHISDNVTEIPGSCFYGCNSLRDFNFPAKLESIGSEAFSSINIERLELPERIKNIGSSAFNSITNLKYVKLNSRFTNGNRTFLYCHNIETLVAPCATPPVQSSDILYGVEKTNIKLIVPDFALEAYKLDPYWYQFGTIESSEEASVYPNWVIYQSLNLEDGKPRMRETPSLEIHPGGSLAVFGNTPQPFDNFKYWTNYDKPASFIPGSNAVSANQLTANFYMPEANKWYFFSPITDIDVKSVKHLETESFVIRTYDGAHRASANATSGNWKNVTEGKLLRGQGYIIQANRPGWVEFPVEATEFDQFFKNSEVTLTLSAYPCDNAPNANWNYIANPYPSWFDIYYIDMEAPITVWTGSTYRALSLLDDNYALRPMEAFFVQKPDVCTEAVMRLSGRQGDNVINHGSGSGKMPALKARRATDSLRSLFNIEIVRGNDNEAADMTRVVVNENASEAYEATCDASKFMSLDSSVAQLFTVDAQGNNLAINERPLGNGSVRLGVYTPAKGESYRIEAARADGKVWIHDAETGITHDLTSAPYSFMAGSNAITTDRFTLTFAPAASSVEANTAEATTVTSAEGMLTVTAAEGVSVMIISADGRTVANAVSNGAALDFNLESGVYIVNAGGASFKTFVK